MPTSKTMKRCYSKFAITWTAICLVYLALTLFIHPAADDYTYANQALEKGILGAQTHFYNTWSGRYTSTFLLTASPVTMHSLFGYRGAVVTLLLLFIGGIYWSLTYLFPNLNSKSLLTLTHGLGALFFTHLPKPSESLYWYAGVVNYFTPLVLICFSAPLLLRLFWWKNLSKGGFFLLAASFITLAGTNETSMFTAIVGLAYCNFIFYLFRRKVTNYGLSLLGLTTLAGIVVAIAPGNAIRKAHFPNSQQLFGSIARTIGSVFEHAIQFLSLPLILISILIIPLVLNNAHYFEALRSKRAIYSILTGLVLVLFCGLFPGHWSMGGNPPPLPR